MTPVTILTDLMRRLPQGTRKTIYSALALVGAVLAVCGYYNIDDLGPVSLARAMEIYTTASPIIAGVAVANVNTPDKSLQPAVGAFDEDVDLASFEPVGDASEVFSEALS